MTNVAQYAGTQGRPVRRSFLRLAVPSIRTQNVAMCERESESLSESHMRALFADELRRKPLMSRLKNVVRAPTESTKVIRNG